MAVPTRGTKTSAGGGTAFVANTSIKASEVNTDFDNIYNEMDNLENANIAASANIALTKIGDASASDTDHATGTDPGDSSSHSNPTTAEGEFEQLRYVAKRQAVGTNAKRLDGTATTDDCYWGDDPVRGPNLIRNGNFAVKTTAAGSAPDGWALVLTPGTCTTTTAGVTEGHSTMRALRVAASGAGSEGIQQTLVGLKASTKYQVGCRVKVNVAGDIVSLTTTGASNGSSGAFDDLDLRTSSTTYTTLSGTILTDSTPTDIVVQLLAIADGDSFDATHVWVRECAEDPLPLSDTAYAYDEITTNTTDHYAAGPIGNGDSGLSADVVCPGPGYVIHVAAKLDVEATGANTAIMMLLEENGTEVDCAYSYIDGNAARNKATVTFDYVNTNPTPGTTYTYTVSGQGQGDDVTRNGSAFSVETPKSWIRVRAYLESGGH